MFTIENFQNGLKNIYSDFGFKVKSEKSTICLFKTITEYNENIREEDESVYSFSLDSSEVESMLSYLATNFKFENKFFCTANSIEVMVENQGHPRMLMYRSERYNASFMDYNIKMGSASQEFILAYICACADPNFQSKKLRIRYYSMEKNACFNDLCQSFRIHTVKMSKKIWMFRSKKRNQLFNHIFSI